MRFFQSTIGLKIMMALTGLVGVGFVVGHMLGNLQIFLGADVLNEYAKSLHHNTALLWGARIVLLSSVLLHIYSAVVLTKRAGTARPTAYNQKGWLKASYASRTMRWGGFIILAFIVYHLLHLTVGAPVLPAAHMAKVDWNAGDVNVAHNVINGFGFLPTTIFYIVAQVMLGLHLTHGVHSMARTLGVSNPGWMKKAEMIAVATGIAIAGGNCFIALSGYVTYLAQGPK